MIPVPTAVPPSVNSCKSSEAADRVLRDRSIAFAYESNICPYEIGTASWRCVRPAFLIDLVAFDFAFNVFTSFLTSVSSEGSERSAAILVADGLTSFEDWPLFT